MCIRRSCALALVLATITISGTAQDRQGSLSPRAVVSGRQEVRAALARALSDGVLTRSEQYEILLLGRDVLEPSDLAGLERTLQRLAPPEQIPGPVARRPAAEARLVAPPPRRPEPPQDDLEEEDASVLRQASYLAAKGDTLPDPAYELVPKPEGKSGAIREEQTAAAPDQKYDQNYDVTYDENGEVLGDASGTLDDGSSIFETPGPFSASRRYIGLSSSVDAFHNPMDLSNRDGNFGVRFAVNGGVPLFQRLGFGVQAGTSAVLSNFHGTEFTGSENRSQNFTTVGIFQRDPMGIEGLSWGFGYDWLLDNYYSRMHYHQWRVKLAYEINGEHEIGLWAAMPDGGDQALVIRGLATVPTVEHFKPVSYGSLYYRHYWPGDTSLGGWVGLAEEPGQFLFGGDARVPITERLSLVGGVNYVLPSASGIAGQREEQWNVSLGIEFLPGPAQQTCRHQRFVPVLPLADNGTFVFRKL